MLACKKQYFVSQTCLLLQEHSFQYDECLPFEYMQEFSQAQTKVLVSLIFIAGTVFDQALLELLHYS